MHRLVVYIKTIEIKIASTAITLLLLTEFNTCCISVRFVSIKCTVTEAVQGQDDLIDGKGFFFFLSYFDAQQMGSVQIYYNNTLEIFRLNFLQATFDLRVQYVFIC